MEKIFLPLRDAAIEMKTNMLSLKFSHWEWISTNELGGTKQTLSPLPCYFLRNTA